MIIQFNPLSVWPAHQPQTPAKNRKTAQFTMCYLDRLALLENELRCLSAKDVLLSAWIIPSRGQIRKDGWPSASAKAAAPGVILSFNSRGKLREFAADQYLDFSDNLYAIAKILEALRGIDRWGGASSGKQYAGFAPVAVVAAPALSVFGSAQAAAVFLAKYAGGWDASAILDNSLVAKSAYNAASLKLHPDTGGSHEGFIRLQQAKELLDKHHNQGG